MTATPRPRRFRCSGSVGETLPYTATAEAVVEASDAQPTITVSLDASAEQVTVPDEMTYTVDIGSTSVEAVTITAIEDVVGGARKVDLADPPDDIITTSTCEQDVVIPAGDSYQCTFTRTLDTLDTVGTALDLVLVLAVDNAANEVEGIAAVAVTVVAPEMGPPLAGPDVRGKTQTPTSTTTPTGVRSSTGASIAALVLLATALTALGGTFIAAGRKGAHRRS